MSIFNRIQKTIKSILIRNSPRLYGRFSSGAGTGEEIGIGEGLEIVNGELKVTNTTTSWDSVTNKPSSFPPSSHTHLSVDISDASSTGTANKVVKYDVSGSLLASQTIKAISAANAGNSARLSGGTSDGGTLVLERDGVLHYLFAPPSLYFGYLWSLPPKSGTLALREDVIPGPYANESIAGGAAYVGVPNMGSVVVYSPTVGSSGNNKKIALVGGGGMQTQALSVVRSGTNGEELTVYLEVVNYNVVSTNQDVVDAINGFEYWVNTHRAYTSSPASSAGPASMRNLANGTDTPPVAVGKIFWTQLGEVKVRRP